MPQLLRRWSMMRRLPIVAGSLMLLGTTAAGAHDFWIIPNAFTVAQGGSIAARGQTSSLFPTTLSAVTPDRIAEGRVITSNSDVPLRGASVTGLSLMLRHRPLTGGQHVVGVRLASRSVRESPASFRRYLDLEGAPEARERYEREGLLPAVGGDSITRRYAKYAKTFVEVGKGARAFHRAFGHPLEFVPLTDPGALRTGDTLRVRLMLLGKPAAFARLHGGSVAESVVISADTATARRAATNDISLHADSAGVVTVVVGRAGVWNLRTIQIVPAVKGSGADWDVHWATMVFAVVRR